MTFNGQTILKKTYKSKGPELLVDLGDKIFNALIGRGIDNTTALKARDDIVDRMRSDWGGELLYFPKGRQMSVSIRDREIYKQFDGNNYAELSKLYDLSVPVIYVIIKKMRKHVKKNEAK